MSILYVLLFPLVSASMGTTTALDIAVLTDTPSKAKAIALAEAVNGKSFSVSDLQDISSDTLLVILDSQRFPGPALEQVIKFITQGGHILVAGGPAFETLLHQTPEGDWVTMSEFLATSQTPHHLIPPKDFVDGNFTMASGLPMEDVKVITDTDGLTMESHFAVSGGWSTLSFNAIAPPENHTILRVRGTLGGNAESLVIEVAEQDGSRWLAAVSPVEGRDEFIVHESQFGYWVDSSSVGRGGPNDRLNMQRAARVALGFASTHQVIFPGDYLFTVSSVETGEISTEIMRYPSAPPLEGLCPAYKTFTTTPAHFEGLGIASDIAFDFSGEIVSPIARPMHPHPDLETTWQPLLKGYNKAGVWNSTPISTTWHQNGASWTFIGFEPDIESLAALTKKLAASIPQGMPNPGPREALREPPRTGARITVADGRFVLDGKPWFAHGINYWPLYVSGMEPQGYFSHWLGEHYYMPDLIEKDLDLLQEMGVNLVSIQYSRPEEAPQLHDFLARCHDRGIFVNVSIFGAHPTNPAADDDLRKRPFVETVLAADLKDIPSIFAYDLAWEPAFGNAELRKRHDHLFEGWVIEQYGSISHAESVWDFPMNRREDGSITGPTDEQVTRDGAHRIMMAAYRRFKDDLISHRYREIIQIIDEIDDTHLYGVRTGLGGTGTTPIAVHMPFQLTSGAAHLDFISPEGWGYTHSNISDAAFVTQYARWAGNGKPVFWAEFGLTVWNGGLELQNIQRDIYDAYRIMLERTSADGWAGWWFPGGYRVDERSDYGIINPDRSMRPTAQLLASCASSLKNLRSLPHFEQTILVHRDEHPLGLAFLVNDRRSVYSGIWDEGAMFSVITPGTDSTSADCPLTGVGGVPFVAPQPPQYLNAEIILQSKTGHSDSVILVNTGEAAWLADDCRLHIIAPDNSITKMSLSADVPRFGQLEMSINASPGSTLVMHAERFGLFGERFICQ